MVDIFAPVRRLDGRQTSFRPSVFTACAGRFGTRRLPNVVLPMPLGKPCAGNPHARFERGSYSPDRARAVPTVGSTSDHLRSDARRDVPPGAVEAGLVARCRPSGAFSAD